MALVAVDPVVAPTVVFAVIFGLGFRKDSGALIDRDCGAATGDLDWGGPVVGGCEGAIRGAADSDLGSGGHRYVAVWAERNGGRSAGDLNGDTAAGDDQAAVGSDRNGESTAHLEGRRFGGGYDAYSIRGWPVVDENAGAGQNTTCRTRPVIE